MNKLFVILLLITTVIATDIAFELHYLMQQDLSLVDNHSEGIPDTDTSEHVEDDIRVDADHLAYASLPKESQLKLDDYKGFFVELFIEIPNPPPKGL